MSIKEEFKTIFLGTVVYQDKKTKKINFKITNASDSIFLATSFMDQFINSISNKNKILDFEIEDFVLSVQYMENFISSNNNELIKDRIIPVLYWNEIDEEEQDYFVSKDVFEECIPQYCNSSATKDNFYSFFEEEIKEDREVDGLSFVKFFFEDNNLKAIETFKKSKKIKKYKEEIDLLLEFCEEDNNELEDCEDIDNIINNKPIFSFHVQGGNKNSQRIDLYSEEEIELFFSNIIKNIFNNSWDNNINFVKNLMETFDENMIVSIVNTGSGNMVSFDLNNKSQMLAFVGSEILNANNSKTLEKLNFVFNIKKFFPELEDEKGQDFHKIASCLLNSQGFLSIPKENCKKAFLTDNQTGETLPEIYNVEYIDFQLMLKLLGIKVKLF